MTPSWKKADNLLTLNSRWFGFASVDFGVLLFGSGFLVFRELEFSKWKLDSVMKLVTSINGPLFFSCSIQVAEESKWCHARWCDEMHDVDGAVHKTFAVPCVAQILRLRDDSGRQQENQLENPLSGFTLVCRRHSRPSGALCSELEGALMRWRVLAKKCHATQAVGDLKILKESKPL